MGICIIYDRYLYKQINICGFKPGDNIPYPKNEIQYTFFDSVKYYLKKDPHLEYQKQIKGIIKLKNRSNIVMMIELIDLKTNKKFIICNTHVPCLFKEPYLQKIFIDTTIITIKKIMNFNNTFTPVILCGDFNMDNISDLYNEVINDNSLCDISKNIEYTINCETDSNGKFKGKIDHIFSLNIKTLEIINKMEFMDNDNIMPNDNCHSDHGAITSFFNLD